MASDTHIERPSITIPGAVAGYTRPPVRIARPRGGQPKQAQTGGTPDAVAFVAACPACGQDCVWSEEREDTRLQVVVTCPCGSPER